MDHAANYAERRLHGHEAAAAFLCKSSSCIQRHAVAARRADVGFSPGSLSKRTLRSEATPTLRAYSLAQVLHRNESADEQRRNDPQARAALGEDRAHRV